MELEILVFFLLLLVDMYFFGFGAAVNSLNFKDIARRAEEEKDKKSMKLQKIIEDPTNYVDTVQLVVTIINVVMGVFYASFWNDSIKRGITHLFEHKVFDRVPVTAGLIGGISWAITLILLIYVLLTFGVLLPKKIAIRIPEKWAYACINSVYFFTKMFSPLTGLVSVSVKGILRIFGVKSDQDLSDVTEEEIISMVNEGHEQGVIEASEAEMINNIFEYGDKEAQDIMTHRNNILALDENLSLKEAIEIMISGHYSRYPVYRENIDHIIGILHLKDAVRIQADTKIYKKPLKELSDHIREAVYIPETRNLDDLFKDMQSQKLQMVIVVDEYGQTSGLVAMEDILEEIVGNIMDEYDEDTSFIEQTSQDEYVIEGITPLEELEERFGIHFHDEKFETLNGFIISKLDRIPEPDEQFDVTVEGYNFKILSVEHNVIQSVLVKKVEEEVKPEEKEQSDADSPDDTDVHVLDEKQEK